MDTLKQLLEEIKPNLSYDELEGKFKMLATHILGQYIIENQGKKYWITDIEFYYYSNQILDRRTSDETKTITYKRTCRPGVWFFHSSGMDLCFESDKSKGFGGGILIRGLRNCSDPQKEINGPINVYNELFDYYVDALSPTSYPSVQKSDIRLGGSIENDVRVNTKHIDANQLKLRYKINAINI